MLKAGVIASRGMQFTLIKSYVCEEILKSLSCCQFFIVFKTKKATTKESET